MPILAIRDLSRRFGERQVVAGLDLELHAGDRVALAGPNGSGKTTILRCLAGTLTPTGGEGAICGHPLGSVAARQATGVSLSQERSFYLRLSGRANLVFFARLRGASQREAERQVAALERELELADIMTERADRCSTGMLQQLAFARSLIGGPPLLLLDEPTRSLDGDALARFWSALDRRRSAAALIATHRDEDIARCERKIDLSS